MQCAIARSTDLNNRWDAEFHIALSQQRDTVNRLLAMPEESFDQLLMLVPFSRDALLVILPRIYAASGLEQLKKCLPVERALYLALALQAAPDAEQTALELERKAAEVRQAAQTVKTLLTTRRSPVV